MVDPASQKCTPSPLQCNARQQQHTREAKVHFLDAGPPQEREGAPLVHLMFAPWCTRWHHDALFAAEPSDLRDAIIAVFFKIHKSIPGTVWGFCHSGVFWVCVLSATQQITQWRQLVDRNWVYGITDHLIHKMPPVQWQIPTIWPVFSNSECDNTIVIIML